MAKMKIENDLDIAIAIFRTIANTDKRGISLGEPQLPEDITAQILNLYETEETEVKRILDVLDNKYHTFTHRITKATNDEATKLIKEETRFSLRF